MSEIDNIITVLESVKNRPLIYLGNKSLNSLECFLNGFHACYVAINGQNARFSLAKENILSSRGWQVPTVLISKEMEGKDFTEEEIFIETLAIEIETWRLLRKET